MFELTHSTEFHQLDAETKRNGFLEILEQFDETSEKEKLRVEQLKLHVNIPIIFKGPRRKLVITSIYAISRFIAKILLVPISPKFFEIYISNYFLSVMNDVISGIDFPKSRIFNFYLIAL